MLKKIRRLDFNANYAYAPPTVSALINMKEVSSVGQAETRSLEPCVLIVMQNGERIWALGTVEDFWP